MSVYTPERRAAMIAAHEGGLLQREIAERFGTSQARVAKCFKKWGVKTRRRGAIRRYTLREDFFEEIETEEQAYWLGFILADGSVYRHKVGNWVISIALAAKDQSHLQALASVMEFNGPVQQFEKVSEKTGRILRMVRIELHSKQLAENLITLGCVPNKTEHGFRCPPIAPRLRHHLYRGYFDGDGCLTKPSTPKFGKYWQPIQQGWNFSVVGHHRFLRDYQNWLVHHGCSRTAMYHKPPMSRVLYKGNQQIARICYLLYKNATVYLTRKYDRACRVQHEAATVVFAGPGSNRI